MVRSAADSLEPYLTHLRALPFVRGAQIKRVHRTADFEFDARIAIETDNGRFELDIEQKKSHLDRSSISWIVARSRADERRYLLFARAIGRPLAERLTASGVNFVDRAGNCFIDLDGRYVAQIEGRREPERSVDATRVRALRGPAYRVLFALLAEPTLVDASLRAIAADSGGVSAQTASDLRADLVARGMLVVANRRHRWNPSRWDDAIDLFAHGYTTGFRESLVVGRFRSKQRDPAALEAELRDALSDEVAWGFGGGAAASLLDGHYRGDRTVVHIGDPPRDIASRLRLVPDPREGNVVIQRAPGALAFRAPENQVVHPLLAYVDLLVEGDERADEAAVAIRERFLGAPDR